MTKEHVDVIFTFIRNGDIDAIKKLVDDYKINSEDLFSLMFSINFNTEIMKFLLDNGANVNLQDVIGNTALHYAVLIGNYKTVKLLIAYGADLNMANTWGYYPMDIINNKNNKIYKLLSRHGAILNPDIINLGAVYFTKSHVKYSH